MNQEIVQEAIKRGLLSPEKADLYKEAVNRGLVGGFAKKISFEDIGKSFLSGAARGLIDIAGLPGFLREVAEKPANFLSDKLLQAVGVDTTQIEKTKPNPLQFPTSEQIESGLEKIAGAELPEPETDAGRYVQAAARGATGSLLGPARALPFMAGTGAAGGVGSEAAGDLTEDNPYWKLFGGVLASTLAGTPAMYKGNAGKMAKDALKDVSEKDIAGAIQKQETARQAGVPLMGPESLPDGSIQQLAGDVFASKVGQDVLSKRIKKRPAQVAQAISRELKQISPESVNPRQALQKGQKAATDVIKNAEKGRTAAVTPLYQKAATETVPTEALESIKSVANKALEKAATKETRNKLQEFIADIELSDGTVGNLDDIYKSWRDKISLPDINAKSIDKTTAKNLSPVLDEINNTLKTTSKDLAEGRNLYQKITRERIEPLNAGPIGQMAGKGADAATTPPEQRILKAVIGDSKNTRPQDIKNVVRELGKVDPEAVPQLTRLYLENAFDQAQKRLQSGEAKLVGANFAKAVYSTPQARSNMKAMIKELAKQNGRNPEQAWRGFNNVLETLGATGKIPGVGSPTATRMATQQASKSSAVAGAMESVSTQPLVGPARKIREFVSRGTYKTLAEAFTDPDSVQKLVKMAKLSPVSPAAQVLVVDLLQIDRQL